MVHSSDRIYHLGDVIWSRASELSDYMRRMPCQSILVRGNHDHNSNEWYESHGFYYVATHIVLDDVILSHKPLKFFLMASDSTCMATCTTTITGTRSAKRSMTQIATTLWRWRTQTTRH